MPKGRPNRPYLGSWLGKNVAGRRVVNIGLRKAGAVVCMAIGLASHVALADPIRLAQAVPAGPMPPKEIVLVVRSAGLQATSEPALTGNTYVVRAVDRYGTPLRVVIDARYGYLLSVHPLAAAEPTHPPYGALGMRTATGEAEGLVPPRAIPLRPPLERDRSLSAAPIRPPLPKPRAATAQGENPKPPERSPDAMSPAVHPAPAPAPNQAARQETFPPVTPLE
jgi:hypothetical protein